MNSMQYEFDVVVKHLFKQGKQSAGDGMCKYRGDAGLMCAVGCRIPDNLYKKGMEGEAVSSLVGKTELPPEIVEYCGMFNDLQKVHDRGYNWLSSEVLKKSLINVAYSYGLEFNMPDINNVVEAEFMEVES